MAFKLWQQSEDLPELFKKVGPPLRNPHSAAQTAASVILKRGVVYRLGKSKRPLDAKRIATMLIKAAQTPPATDPRTWAVLRFINFLVKHAMTRGPVILGIKQYQALIVLSRRFDAEKGER